IAALAEPDVDAEVDGKPSAQLDALLHQSDVDLGRPLLAHAAAIASGGALGEIATLEYNYILHAAAREVIRDGEAHDAAADDGDLGALGHGAATLERGRQPDLTGDVSAALVLVELVAGVHESSSSKRCASGARASNLIGVGASGGLEVKGRISEGGLL